MIRAVKIRIIPTKEQEIQFKKSCGVARWAYNFYLSEKEKAYKESKQTGTKLKFISEQDVRKYINNVLKPTEEYKWLKEVSSNVMKQAIKEADFAYNMFFNGKTSKPKFKSKKDKKMSFYVNYESLHKTQNGFRGEKLGNIKTSQSFPDLKFGEIYYRPRIVFDGKYWYISVSLKKEVISNELTTETLGIDLGIKELAVCSNGKIYHNINKSNRIKQLEKRLIRENRKMSRRMVMQVDHYEPTEKARKPIFKKDLKECANIQKSIKNIRLIQRHINNIRINYIHQTTRSIVKTKPCKIVMEKITIKGLMKNKILSKSIKYMDWGEFKRQIQYKCEEYGIEFVEANKFYPSTKICSNCGNIKETLPLKIRTYKCEHCGMVMDRDLNASINLSRYNK